MTLAGHAYWIVIILFIAGFVYLIWGLKAQRTVEIQSAANSGCMQGRITFKVDDQSMNGLLTANQTYEAFTEWKNCIKLEAGDVVLYRYSKSGEPVARKVAAVPGDRFELVRNPEKNNWKILVNGSIYESDGKPYTFGSVAVHPISLYEKAHKGQLDNQSLIIFSNRTPGNRDSGEFGVVNMNDIIGIVSRHQSLVQQGESL